jgi:hypothetical protein
MKLKYHTTLTEEKWGKFDFYKQILMIANELNRAKNWIEKKDFREVKLCYERAFELLYLTIEIRNNKKKLRELLRFKEMLGMLYMKDYPTLKENFNLLKILVSLDKDSFKMLQF